MINILQKIKAHKVQEVDNLAKEVPINVLSASSLFSRDVYSLTKQLSKATSPAIIAEFKRQSPSKGIINSKADAATIPVGYQKSGASAVSVLTDTSFFGAQESDFSIARSALTIPMLRKDFIIHPYQVYETKAMGADLMLLIAAILHPDEVYQLASLARDLGLEVFLEIHDEKEIDCINEHINIIGINNRDLKSFHVDTENSRSLIQKLPAGIPKIAESGLKTSTEVKQLFTDGFAGFLIGETFMKTEDPAKSCFNLIKSLQNG